MSRRLGTLLVVLIACGAAALLLALAAIVDLALPRPWDGVVLETDLIGTLAVREVVPGSGADRAGIRPVSWPVRRMNAILEMLLYVKCPILKALLFTLATVP